MGLFEKLYAPERKTDAPPVPEKGFKLYWFLMTTHITKLVLLNALFILFCLPVVTIPAAMTAMTRVLMKLVRDGNCLIWQEYWGEFKTNFFGRFGMFLLLAALPYAVFFYMSIFGVKGTLLTFVPLFFLVLVFLVLCYFFPLAAMVDLRAGQTLKNALYLCILEWKSTLKLLLVAAVYALHVLFFPYTVPLILLLLFSFSQLAVCMIINPVIVRRFEATDVDTGA
ncbi:YesL family protein [Christensenellaceae bacterium OttesenSCG-928-L17]|nr:YesL family protein [Christensenellaceae bacterium OttesenSCG-928-L17]